jgi:hypothetical protein
LAGLGVCVVFNGGRQSRILFFPVFITPPTYSGPHRVSETSAHGDVSLGSCGGDLSVGRGAWSRVLLHRLFQGEVTDCPWSRPMLCRRRVDHSYAIRERDVACVRLLGFLILISNVTPSTNAMAVYLFFLLLFWITLGRFVCMMHEN